MVNKMIDRKKLRESLTDEHIIYLMSLLGATKFLDKGNYIQFHTICHNEREENAGVNLSYYKDSKRFYCFSNCASMDIFTLVRNRWELLETGDDIHFENIAYWVMNHSGVDLDHSPPTFVSHYNKKDYENPTQEVILPEKSEKVLEVFNRHYCIEWLNDNISKEAMDKYNILYSSIRNAIIIPHYDVNGRLIGVRRRALNQEDIERGKYKPIYIENVSYSHPLGYNLYGLNLVKDEVQSRGKIVIAEGEKSPLQSYTLYGERNYVVAACGNRINRWQIHLIMKYCKPREIIIAFDKGIKYEYLEKMCRRYLAYCNMSFTYDFQGWLKDKESPFDAGQEKLEKLLHNRVRLKY